MAEQERPEPLEADDEPLEARDDTLIVEVVDEDVDAIISEAMDATESSKLESVRAEAAEVREQWVRTLADFDNFRKRTEREQKELRRYALADPMRELVGVVDNLERATDAAGSVDDLKQGVEMILGQLQQMLEKHGVEPIPAEGEEFDPSLHDAVSRHEDPNVSVPMVSAELQRGYKLHDRLLRPSMVQVAVPAERAAEAETEDE